MCQVASPVYYNISIQSTDKGTLTTAFAHSLTAFAFAITPSPAFVEPQHLESVSERLRGQSVTGTTDHPQSQD